MPPADRRRMNPIAEQLGRGAWPRGQVARWLDWTAVAAGFVLAAGLPGLSTQPGPRQLVLTVLGLGALFLWLLYLSICLVGAVLLVGRAAAEDQIALLRVTGLPGRAMVDGFIGGIAARMRLVQSLGLWLPGGLIGGEVAALVLLGPPDLVIVWLVLAIAAALPITGIWLLLYGLGQVLTHLGVMVGLRWPRRAVGIGAGMALGVIVLLALAAAVAVMVLRATEILGVAIVMMSAGLLGLAGLAGLIWLETRLRKAIIDALDGRAASQGD